MDYESLIRKAKNEIEKDWEKIKKKDNDSKVKTYLLVASSKAIRLSDAIVYLCKGNFSNESLIILRSLIEHSINMRWIMNKNTKDRLQKYFVELKKINFGNGWADLPLDQRMKEIGFENKDYFDFVVKFTYGYAHVNSSSLTPEIGKDIGEKHNFSPEAIYSVTAQMLGHVLKALNVYYSVFFNGYKIIWARIPERLNTRESLTKEWQRVQAEQGQ